MGVALAFAMTAVPAHADSFVTTPVPLQSQRSSHTTTLLQNGRLLVAGGTSGNDSKNTVEIVDPMSGSVQGPSSSPATPVMTAHRLSHTATLLHDGRVLLAGGATVGSPAGTDATVKADLYDAVTN